MHDVCLCLASDVSLRAASIQASSLVSLRALRSRRFLLIGFGETLRLLCACVRAACLCAWAQRGVGSAATHDHRGACGVNARDHAGVVLCVRERWADAAWLLMRVVCKQCLASQPRHRQVRRVKSEVAFDDGVARAARGASSPDGHRLHLHVLQVLSMVVLHLVEGSPRIDPTREHHHHADRTQAQAEVRVLDHVRRKQRRHGKHPAVLRAREQVERCAVQGVHNLCQRKGKPNGKSEEGVRNRARAKSCVSTRPPTTTSAGPSYVNYQNRCQSRCDSVIEQY